MITQVNSIDNISINLNKKDTEKKESLISSENINNIEKFPKTEQKQNIDKIYLENENYKYEQLISNNDFGYNDKSKDFYIKVERGNQLNQYPTDEMMKIKAFVLEQLTNRN